VLLTAPEVAALFGVDPTAIARWAHDGWLPFFTTPGGHYRFPAEDVYRLLASIAQRDPHYLAGVCSSAMISLHKPMHSLQM
jgi:excisionase family DNA binding protein